jgi:hypothetical protein
MNRLTSLNKLNTSLIFELKNLSKIQQQKKSFSKCQYMLAGNVKDYKPGDYPKNEQERIAAAKKYGLRYKFSYD